MARDPKDEAIYRHRQWLGYLQPVGVVVSAPALAEAGVYVGDTSPAEHQEFLDLVKDIPVDRAEPAPAIPFFPELARKVFGWDDSDLVTTDDPRMAGLEVHLETYHETLRATYAVPDVTSAPDGSTPWLLLVEVVEPGADLDAHTTPTDSRRWDASPQARFERLLKGAGVPIGLLFNATDLRLVYAPQGETAGHITFPVKFLAEVGGRPAFAAMKMLLSAGRLFTAADRQRLPALLAQSRKFQNTVSTELAEQVLAALFELLRGFQAADAQAKGDLLRGVLAADPNHVYAGLVTVLMRLVFLLYAEDRGLMAGKTRDDEIYHRFYSVTGLYDRLREDAGRHPDTMDLRYGAWPQLLALFRLVHDGSKHGGLLIPARHGYLFDYARKYAFLEGRPHGVEADPKTRLTPPLVSDGVVFRVLNNLMVLDGERISYLTLDVEQIGSVYEAIMGYRLEVAGGPSIALKAKKAHGAPVTINLDALLTMKAADRGKWLSEQADQKVDGKALTALKAADTVEGLVAALERKVARTLTPNIVPSGGMVLQPSDERRRSGSHYTPRSLTGPIVSKALEPVLKQLGDNPTPEQILGLKVCDPAMGSGAFLVEACRQLGDSLLKAWVAHGKLPKVPEDETPELLAQRTVAQRCLYGVDKNPMAVDLAKLSLWLATLAKDHPFTFLDHNLKCGDSLVGLTAKQIRTFHWSPGEKVQGILGQEKLRQQIDLATRYRWVILESGDWAPELLKEQQLKLADEAIKPVRLAGNLVVAAYFAAEKDKKRLEKRDEYLRLFNDYLHTGLHRPNTEEAALWNGPHPVQPFHWEIEFPEVFQGTDGGFHCIVGNPPFLGGSKISANCGDAYLAWLLTINTESHGNADVVAYFFRRAFSLLRPAGTFGMIATNTIAQGDTRSSGLRWICSHGGNLYSVRRRYRWPGQAAVIVSISHIINRSTIYDDINVDLDGRQVEFISAYFFSTGGNEDPAKLSVNSGQAFGGAKIYGQGFILTPHERQILIDNNYNNNDRIFPYVGGEEVNDHPCQSFHRYVINFGTMTLEEARRWPQLLKIVEEKVKPERDAHTTNAIALRQQQYWWRYRSDTPNLFSAIQPLSRCLSHSQVSAHLAFAFLPNTWLYAHTLYVFAFDTYSAFCTLQSRVHEIWARFFSSSMKDDMRYTPSDCFETFPFPESFESNPVLETAGKAYYEFRADLMVRNNEGLTKTYNRFHDPNETSADILRLRELHGLMDRAVLDAYGGDLGNLTVPPCEFLLDYEDEEDEDELQTGRQRKKPWRFRWPDVFRDEVLALLLELNKQRAEQERLAAPVEKTKRTPRPKRTDKRPDTTEPPPSEPGLYDAHE